MRILVDAMGGDNAPDQIALGAIQAAKDFNCEVVLVGRGEAILRALKDQGIAESVAIVEHFFHMFSAKACFVCLITDITFHVRRAVSENEVEGVLLQFTFYKAEWTFVIGVYGIIKRDGI
jgi:hypothetical protein